jgi:hypothetical protein
VMENPYTEQEMAIIYVVMSTTIHAHRGTCPRSLPALSKSSRQQAGYPATGPGETTGKLEQQDEQAWGIQGKPLSPGNGDQNPEWGHLSSCHELRWRRDARVGQRARMSKPTSRPLSRCIRETCSGIRSLESSD